MRKAGNDNLAVGSRRRLVFMDYNLYRYQQTLRKADEQMAQAIKKMHVGIYEWVLLKCSSSLEVKFILIQIFNNLIFYNLIIFWILK